MQEIFQRKVLKYANISTQNQDPQKKFKKCIKIMELLFLPHPPNIYVCVWWGGESKETATDTH
jgi:hypothetical protein